MIVKPVNSKELDMEQYMDDYENYKRFVRNCKCGCEMHCNQKCQNCNNCKECECEYCKEGQGQN